MHFNDLIVSDKLNTYNTYEHNNETLKILYDITLLLT